MILKFDEYFIHVLIYLKHHGASSGARIREEVASSTGATLEEKSLTTNKGTHVVNSRIYWAIQYLYQAGALDRPSRGVYEITQLGSELLNKFPNGFPESALKDTDGYRLWHSRMAKKETRSNEFLPKTLGEAPHEAIESALQEIENTLAAEIVSRLQELPPEFLEKTVLKLLGAMGYGIDQESLKHTGGPGDEGIDGMINQDRLGLQQIYIQAKRYKDGNNISRENIQSFIGAMQSAAGGVFITTSAFTSGALDYASKHLSPKVVLIDGATLGQLLVKFEVGAVVKNVYQLVEMDENFFSPQ